MDQQKIIDKICKCLRLSASCNPNEAAAALRQAYRLMRKHQISEQLVRTAYVTEKGVDTGLAETPPFWALALLNLVADAFDCRGFVDRHYGNRSEFRFIGVGASPEVATYSFTILLRKLNQARDEFLQNLEVCDEGESQRRADVFAQAWLFRVARTVRDFVENRPLREAVEEYVQQKYGDTGDILQEPILPEERDYDDILLGMQAAQGVSLFQAMSAGRTQILRLKATA